MSVPSPDSPYTICTTAARQEADDPEGLVVRDGEGLEIRIYAEDARETAAGGLVFGKEGGGKSATGRKSGDEPFERDSVVEGENLAETLGEFLVAQAGL